MSTQIQFDPCLDLRLQRVVDVPRREIWRAWEERQQPRLHMVLDLGPRGRFAYSVRPHLLFTGGVQLDVQGVEEARSPWPGTTAMA